MCLFPQNYTKAMRLFVGEPVWKAYNRPADDFDIRKTYVATLQESWEEAEVDYISYKVNSIRTMFTLDAELLTWLCWANKKLLS